MYVMNCRECFLSSDVVILQTITVIIPSEIWHCALLKYSRYYDSGGDNNGCCDNNGTNHNTANNDNPR